MDSLGRSWLFCKLLKAFALAVEYMLISETLFKEDTFKVTVHAPTSSGLQKVIERICGKVFSKLPQSTLSSCGKEVTIVYLIMYLGIMLGD